MKSTAIIVTEAFDAYVAENNIDFRSMTEWDARCEIDAILQAAHPGVTWCDLKEDWVCDGHTFNQIHDLTNEILPQVWG